MGLFGGDFGSGFATGLAESVDQSLKTALDKREKEMSRAREFWMTRQAQKMDLADDHDKRAGDALDAFITEFNGDVAKGLAAYKHFKTVDGAEAGLAEIEASRAALGKFDVNDYFTFEGIDLGQFADLSRDDAFASIRADSQANGYPDERYWTPLQDWLGRQRYGREGIFADQRTYSCTYTYSHQGSYWRSV